MKRVGRESMLVGTILLVALLVRVWGVNYDLPYIYHPDEPHYITISQNIFKTGDLNPHFFNYPSLFFYINALAYTPYYLLGKLIGVFDTPNDILPPSSLTMGVTHAQTPTAVLLGRIVTIIFGVGTVGLTYSVGKQITGKAIVGMLASLMVAFSPTNVFHSRLITPDTFVTFFSLASFLASIQVYQQGKTWQYIAAGIGVGLTLSSKYNGGLIVLPLLLAHLIRYGKAAFKEFRLYLALLFCGIGFLATTPYAILDLTSFLTDLRSEAIHYSTGHPGMEGNTLKWYLEYVWQTVGVISILSVLEILRGICLRSKEIILLSIFPIVYFVFISSFVVRNDRTLLPLTPFLFLLSASFIGYLISQAGKLQSKTWRKLTMCAIICLSIASFILPISKTLTGTIKLTTMNSRETARIWINNNLPIGAKIAIESYSPFIDLSRFSVRGFGSMIEHTPEWYVENGFDYLIFSEGMYGRFYREPERYRDQVLQYDNFFSRFHLIRTFADGGFEIRIYEVK